MVVRTWFLIQEKSGVANFSKNENLKKGGQRGCSPPPVLGWGPVGDRLCRQVRLPSHRGLAQGPNGPRAGAGDPANAGAGCRT